MRRLRRSVTITVLAGMALATPAYGQEQELALQGYCPVSYHTLGRAVLGDSAFKATYEGYLYYLADAESKSKFEAEPQRYAPQFAGLCTTALGGSYGNRIPSDPTVFVIVDGKLYMFSSERARRNFDTKPQDYIATATQRYSKPAIAGYCPVAYFSANAAKKGDDKIKLTYRGRIYYFADEAAKSAFAKEPEKYLPAYQGFCAEGVSRGKKFPGDPKIFLVREGRLFLFFDENAKKTFEADAAALTKTADVNWPNLRTQPPMP